MRKLSFCLILLLGFLVSCKNVPIEKQEPEDPFGPIEPAEPKEYKKDTEGFYELEENYFTNTSIKDNLKTSKLRFSKTIDSTLKYTDMRLYVGDEQVPLYHTKVNVSQTWNAEAPHRTNNAVGIIELDGVMTFKLHCNFLLNNECKISPLNANVDYIIDEARRVITFKISQPGQYTIELRSKRTLHLFVNEYKQYDEHKNDANLIYFGPGIHTAKNSEYISSDNYIHIQSNQTIFVDLGAVLECGMMATNASNYKIVGSGIITGENFDRSATTGSKLIPYEFTNCKNFEIKGITTLDPAGWCYNIYFCNNVHLDNIKIISSRSNGDGISLQSCQDVICKNSFVRSWDDSLVVKNYPKWPSTQQGTTKNILFYNCIVWTDLAQSMEIGFETIGLVMENIVFDNIVVIHNYHKACISIHNGNNANIKGVKFQNITIQDAHMGLGDGNTYLIDFSTEFSSIWSTNHATTSLGTIDDVLVKNVLVLEGISKPLISLRGCIDTRLGYGNSVHKITNVVFEDVSIYSQILNNEYQYFYMQYTDNIQYKSVLPKVNGANYILFQDSKLYGLEYIIEHV